LVSRRASHGYVLRKIGNRSARPTSATPPPTGIVASHGYVPGKIGKGDFEEGIGGHVDLEIVFSDFLAGMGGSERALTH
jgi:hypothetical protein